VKICIILEGSYPYERGGVSNWVDGIIKALPQHEFILWTIADTETKRGQYQYELPQNVLSIHEYFIDAALKTRINQSKNIRFSSEEKREISKLIRCKDPDWSFILNQFTNRIKNPIEVFTSEDFLDILEKFAQEDFPFVGFTDLFWTIRSMFLPLFYLLEKPLPQADIYHSASTGYAGVLGAFASIKYHAPYIVTEHGIYTREREEEILRSDWTPVHFKEYWVSMFYMYSRFAYNTAHQVTSLFQGASLIQHELGCPPEKCEVVSNGIVFNSYAEIPLKEDNGWIDIGAIVRVAPIKDLKTLIYTFSRLKQEMPKTRLHILGGIDDQNYYEECQALINFLGVSDIIFTGLVNVREYMARLDFTILTSISEGQPLSLIESMAAQRPVIATNVGACCEMINGVANDNFGPAGFCVPPMDQTALLQAMIEICRDVQLRRKMGQARQNRARALYRHTQMVENYKNVYQKAIKVWQESGLS